MNQRLSTRQLQAKRQCKEDNHTPHLIIKKLVDLAAIQCKILSTDPLNQLNAWLAVLPQPHCHPEQSDPTPAPLNSDTTTTDGTTAPLTAQQPIDLEEIKCSILAMQCTIKLILESWSSPSLPLLACLLKAATTPNLPSTTKYPTPTLDNTHHYMTELTSPAVDPATLTNAIPATMLELTAMDHHHASFPAIANMLPLTPYPGALSLKTLPCAPNSCQCKPPYHTAPQSHIATLTHHKHQIHSHLPSLGWSFMNDTFQFLAQNYHPL